MPKMTFRGWITLITLLLLVIVVIFAWPEIVKAWNLLDQVNLWILALLIPVQLFSYYATGGMIFSYLRAKGDVKDMSRWGMARISLELNFVNHILPSGGAAGFSYLGWVLGRHGVRPGRSTMSQIVRFALTFISFLILLVAAVVFLIIDHRIDRLIIVLCSLLMVACVGATVLVIYIIGNSKRLEKFSNKLTRFVNGFVRKVTRGRVVQAVQPEVIPTFFLELHQDYIAIRKDKRILIKPFIWAILANMADVALIWIAFWSLGFVINPAILFVAFGLSSIASAVSVTPGGAGVYEAIMIAFLASSNVSADVAIAGTLLARVTLVVGTVLFGYIFYQLTVMKYGRRPPLSQ
ncbi:flippase-like domain-containing protein [Candidatus Saccharibacteria bacterium]|nr:flippase-like domain-containing protein [Candidatus Saccharibacteria bacterium]